MAVILMLIAVRVLNILNNAPEYDELWTVQHYLNLPAAEVVSDVATPNNHVLNTLGIKLFSGIIPNRNLAMRMTSLLGFCGLCVVLLLAVTRFLKTDAARGIVLAAVLLDGMILHYAETARGYSLQTFFVFGLFLSLLRIHPGERGRPWLDAFLWLVCALGSCLSVAFGAVHVAVLTGLWALLYLPFRGGVKRIWDEWKYLVPAGACCLVFVLAWYGGNYARFAQGQAEFGETFRSLPQYLRYFGGILLDTDLFAVLPFLAAGGVLLWRRGETEWKLCALTGGAVVLALLASVVTKGGPPRIFLPLFPVALFGLGIALDRLFLSVPAAKRYEHAVLLVVFVFCACVSEPRRKAESAPDLVAVFSEVAKMDEHVFAAYHPKDLYVVLMLFGNAAREDNGKRLLSPQKLLLLHENVIFTVRSGESEVDSIPPGGRPVASDTVVRGQDFMFWLYDLRPIQPGEPLHGNAVLCFASAPIPEDAFDKLTADFAFVNGMLSDRADRICLAAPGDGLDADTLRQMEQDHSGRLFFRVVVD